MHGRPELKRFEAVTTLSTRPTCTASNETNHETAHDGRRTATRQGGYNP